MGLRSGLCWEAMHPSVQGTSFAYGPTQIFLSVLPLTGSVRGLGQVNSLSEPQFIHQYYIGDRLLPAKSRIED